MPAPGKDRAADVPGLDASVAVGRRDRKEPDRDRPGHCDGRKDEKPRALSRHGAKAYSSQPVPDGAMIPTLKRGRGVSLLIELQQHIGICR
jgi:hypothetical protein